MSSRMPPVPPANRSKKGPKRAPEVSKDKKLAKHEHHANARGRGRYRQYQAEHHERGLLPRPAGILVVYRFLEGTAEEYMMRKDVIVDGELPWQSPEPMPAHRT
jgi:hypothetical protein